MTEKIYLPIILENENEDDDINIENVEEKKKPLLILSTLGQTKEYFGKEISCAKIYNMKKETVEKYFSIYQKIQTKQTTKVLINQGLNLAVNGISYFFPLEDKEILIQK